MSSLLVVRAGGEWPEVIGDGKLPTYHAPPPHPDPNPDPNPDQVRALAREKRIELPHVLKEIDASPGALRALRRRVRASLLIPPYTPLPPLTPPYIPLHPGGHCARCAVW